MEHGTAYLGYSASASQHSRHPFFASGNRAGGPAKGDIQLVTVRKETTLAELLKKVGGLWSVAWWPPVAVWCVWDWCVNCVKAMKGGSAAGGRQLITPFVFYRGTGFVVSF